MTRIQYACLLVLLSFSITIENALCNNAKEAVVNKLGQILLDKTIDGEDNADRLDKIDNEATLKHLTIDEICTILDTDQQDKLWLENLKGLQNDKTMTDIIEKIEKIAQFIKKQYYQYIIKNCDQWYNDSELLSYVKEYTLNWSEDSRTIDDIIQTAKRWEINKIADEQANRKANIIYTEMSKTGPTKWLSNYLKNLTGLTNEKPIQEINKTIKLALRKLNTKLIINQTLQHIYNDVPEILIPLHLCNETQYKLKLERLQEHRQNKECTPLLYLQLKTLAIWTARIYQEAKNIVRITTNKKQDKQTQENLIKERLKRIDETAIQTISRQIILTDNLIWNKPVIK